MPEDLADSTLAELLIFAAEAGVSFGVGAVVEIVLLFDAGDNRLDGVLPPGAGLDAGAHETPEFGFCAHTAAERLDGVVVEAGLVEERFGFHCRSY